MFALVLAYHIWTEIKTKTKIWLAIKNCKERRKGRNDNSAELRNVLESSSDEEDEAAEPTFSIIERLTPQKPLSELVEEGLNEIEEEAITEQQS